MASGPVVDLTHEYESLRRGEREGWGRAVLVHRGMVAWMRAWPVSTAVAPVPAATASRASTQQVGTLPAGWREDVVPVLATMVLRVSRE